VRSHVSELARPRRGHFDLGTGYHGDLWLDLDGLFLFPDRLRPDVQRLADRLCRYQPSAVCGPLAGGAFLALMIASMLGVAFLPAYPGPGPSQPPGAYRLAPALRDRIDGWRVAVVDDAINAGTAVRASCQELRDAGAVPVAVAALLAIGRASTVVTDTLGLPFHAGTTMPSQVWPAAGCPLCQNGTPLDQPAA
jgi:orotate phosphoribosyltransferase